MTRTDVGRYSVTMPNLGLNGGIAHVTSVGFDATTCNVQDWVPSGTAQLVRVQCFDPGGVFADSMFTVSFVNLASAQRHLAYVWADQPSATTYTPSSAHQFNSTGATNTVNRVGPGYYSVHLPGMKDAVGYLQVTAQNTTAGRCKAHSQGPSQDSDAMVVAIFCTNLNGSMTDTAFTFSYSRNAGFTDTLPAAYALPNQIDAVTPYAPTHRFNSTGATNTATRLAPGIYRLATPNMPLDGGHVQAVAYGPGGDGFSNYCKVMFWTPDYMPGSGLYVACFTVDGAPANGSFNAVFLE
ncbi:hypothetical protein ACIBQX_40455 [Nonomuraea sp. NPDC049714]|uniref:hypothetical protein n=1 Tax=Nonomuraea sp. NPDC049714 TaxID=3364357 RepID=UPI0037A9559E